jgi:hypothetical protein
LLAQSNVLLVKELANRASRLQGISLPERIETLTDLADVLWKYDPVFAGQLFDKAVDLFGSASAVASTPGKEKTTEAIDPVRLATVRARVLARLTKHDPLRAKRFADAIVASAEETQKSRNSSSGAGSPGESAQNSKGKAQGIVTYLIGLRSQTEPTANQLFLRALDDLASQSDVDGNDLMALGAYLFTAPSGLAPEGQTSLLWVVINGVRTVNLSTDRPGLNRDLAQAYLRIAAGILIRPVTDLEQRELYYLASYQLYGKAVRFAPDLVPVFAGAMRKHGAEIPSSFSDEATYETLSRPQEPISADEELARIEKVSVSSEREQRYLGLAYSAYRKSDFSLARRAAEKIQDLDAQTTLRRLIKFGELTLLLDQGKIEAAESGLNDRGPNIEDAILSLRIARWHVDKRSKEKSLEWINNALVLSRRINDPRSPFLILAAVDLLGYYDASAASSLLAEAVHDFNAKAEAIQLEKLQWAETVKAGNRSIRFRLDAKNLSLGSFSNALRTIAKSDPDFAKTMVLSLKNEQLLSAAIAALAHGLLT